MSTTQQANTVTFKRVCTGQFEVYVNGELTKYQIVNGSLGMSGRDTANVYGIVKPNGSVVWIGPLNSCKKGLIYSLGKASPAPLPASVPVPKVAF